MAFLLQRHKRPPWVFSLLAALIVIALSGCARTDATEEDSIQTVRQVTESLIAGPVAEQAGLGDLSPTCPDMAGAVAGFVFECRALTEAQQAVTVDGVIQASGHVQLTTRNVIRADALQNYERVAIEALNVTHGMTLANEAIDCGSRSLVIEEDQVLVCSLLDPQTDKIFDVSLTVTDVNNTQFTLLVADQPR